MTPAELENFYWGEPQLVELMQSQAEWVTKCLADGTSEDWAPHLTAVCLEPSKREMVNHLFAFQVPLNMPTEKRQAMANVGMQLFEAHVIPLALVFTAEAWRSTNEQYRGQLQNDPNRQEIVTLAGATIDFKVCAATRAFITRKREKISLGNWEPILTGPTVRPGILWPVFEAFLLCLRGG